MTQVLVEPEKAVVWEDGSAICLARLIGPNRQVATQSSFGSIQRRVFDLDGDTPTTAIEAGSADLTISSSVFNTLQTDARWTKDATGYNFLDTIPSSVFTLGKHRYRVEYKTTAASGEIGWFVYLLTTKEIWSS